MSWEDDLPNMRENYHGPFLIDDKAFDTTIAFWRMNASEENVGYIEANVLVDGTIMDSVFFKKEDKEELEEWIRLNKDAARAAFEAGYPSVTEIFLLEHNHLIYDTRKIDCDCGEKIENPKPYWSTAELYEESK